MMGTQTPFLSSSSTEVPVPVCSDDDDQSQTGSEASASWTPAPNLVQVPPQDAFGTNDENAEERLSKSRERNREHARRTRLRKKAQMQTMRQKVKELETENLSLRQSVEECSIASILLGMSSGETAVPTTVSGENPTKLPSALPPKKRQRTMSNSSDLTISIDGVSTVILGNGKTHINWKNGVYSDENGDQKQLTPSELETLRRERNRRHAKMTRERKKNLLVTMKQTIRKLEEENNHLRERLGVSGRVSPCASVTVSN